MMKKGCLLLCATALSLAWLDNQAQASINFNLKAPPILSVADRHTQHTPNLSAQSLSSPILGARELRVAQVCWITDTDDCGGADFVGTDLEGGTPEVVPPGAVMPKAVSEWGIIKPHVRAAIRATNIVR